MGDQSMSAAAVPDPPELDQWLTHHRMAAHARAYPDRISLTSGDEHISYAEWNLRANRVAHRLCHAGVRRESVVAVLVEKTSPDFVVAALAVWKSGAVYVPIDPRTPAAQVELMLGGVEPAALIGPARLAEPFEDYCPVTILTDRHAADIARMPSSDPDVPMSPDDLAYIVHTSGSTGVPKPVAVTHRAFITVYLGWEDRYELGLHAPISLQAASPAFDVHIGDIARALLSGGRLVLCPSHLLLDPPMLAALIERESVNLMELTPTVWRLLTGWLVRTGRTLPSLRLVMAGGEQLTVADYRLMRQAVGPATRIVNSYGVSEAGIDSTYQDVTDEILGDDDDVVPIGYPFPHSTVAVLDERSQPVGDGVIGEMYLAGDGLARGYHRRPDITEERFLPCIPGMPGPKMYRTGDLVRIRHDGAIVYVGRVDDEVKIRGTRIRLSAVESGVLKLAEVAQAAVVRADRSGEATLVAHVVLADGIDVSDGIEQRLRTDAARHLADAMVPAEFVVHSQLPLSRSGKIDRRALRTIADPSAATTGHIVGLNAVERAVIDIWRRVLGRPPRNHDDDLFEAGGTSLTVARMVATIRMEIQSDVSMPAILSGSSFTEVCATVAAAGRNAEPIPVAADATTEGPLAPGQYGLWLLHQLRAGDPAYHLPTIVRLRGPLDEPALRRALDLLVERHDALRTCFVVGPRLRVLPPMSFPLEVVQDEDDPAAVAEEIIGRPFDLEQAPLCRGVLIHRGLDHADLVLVIHHLVSDDWSERVLLRALGETYTALRSGREPRAADRALGFLDLAVWRDGRLAGEAAMAQRQYWRDRLANPPAALDLPAAAPASRVVGAKAAQSVDLSAELAERVRATASAHRVTPYVLLLSAFGMLLRRWSGQEDLVIGAPFGYRDRPETQDLIGFLVSTLPLRLVLPAAASIADVLATTRDAVAGASANSDVPFDQMVHDLGAAGASDRNQLFRVWFNWLGLPAEPPAMAGLDTEVAHLTVAAPLFDLAVYVTELPDAFRLDFVLDPAVVDDGYLPHMVEQYRALVAELCCSSEEDNENAEARGDLRRPVAALVPSLARRAACAGDRVALQDGSRAVRYSELYQCAGAMSQALRAAGVVPGDVVSIHGHRAGNLVVAMLGTLGAGAAFCILDADYPVARSAERLRATNARVGVRLGRAVPPELSSTGVRWIGVPRPEASPGPWPAAESDRAYLAFTSGTTGQPKQVLGGPQPLAHFLAWYTDRWQIGDTDRFAMVSGLGHDPLLRDVLTPLWVGGTLCVPPAELLHAPADLLAWLWAEKVTVLHVTPALGRLLATPAHGPALSDVRLVVCGGDSMHAADVSAIRSWAPAATIVNVYGTTETPQVVSFVEVDLGLPQPDRLPIGAGAPGAELLVLNERGRMADVGELGEIVVRGPYLAESEAVAPDEVAGHRRFHTGDLGRRGPTGQITVLGRIDDQVNVRGFRVDLVEVDRHLRAQDEVVDALSRVVPGPGGENQVIGYIVPRAGVVQPARSVRTRMRAVLPEYMVPARIITVDRISVTPHGKPDRDALPKPETTEPGTAVMGAPSTELQRLVGDVWCQVLAIDRIGMDQNVFDLGASSLLVTKAHGALESALGVSIPIATLFEYTTVRDIAGHLGGQKKAYDAVSSGRRAMANARSRRLAARASDRGN
jgi:amino acid adenylation domain-containing protein